MYEFFAPDNRLKFNDVSSFFRAFELLNFTVIGGVSWRNLNVFHDDVKMLDVSINERGENMRLLKKNKRFNASICDEDIEKW